MIAEEEETQETQDMEDMGWEQTWVAVGHGRCYERKRMDYWDFLYQQTVDGQWFAAVRTYGQLVRGSVSPPLDSLQAAAAWLELELSK